MIYKFRREPLPDMRPLSGLLEGGLKKGESIIDYMCESEIDYIWNRFKDPLDLIDYADDVIIRRTNQAPIKYPFQYVIKIAENQFWPEQYKKGH